MLHFAFHYKYLPKHVFIVSFVVFLVLNLVENIYHYSIGRRSDVEGVKWVMPTRLDWLHIVVVMILFGLLQALFTCLFVGC
jgi:hypothetical protein